MNQHELDILLNIESKTLDLLKLLFDHNLKLDKIMATQQEAAAQLGGVLAELQKANTEIQAKIQALVDAANNASNVTPELQAAVDALVPAAQSLDDIVPDTTA